MYRIAATYRCFDADRVSLMAVVCNELELRIRTGNVRAYRQDIVETYGSSCFHAMIRPYEELLAVARTGRPFNLRTMSHQIALFDVLNTIKLDVLSAGSADLNVLVDIVLGELVDHYGEDDVFYAYARASSAIVHARSPATPGFAALFERSLGRDAARSFADWMCDDAGQFSRTPSGPCPP